MARRTAPDYARLCEYRKRQLPPRWGHRYQAAIRATTGEAPSISHCYLIRSLRLGRDLHVLSNAERDAVLLALWHPALLDLHEQRVLWPFSVAHPLADSPYAVHQASLPPLAGTFAVAKRLGVERSHPCVPGPRDPEHPDRTTLVPFPLVGDLLLFLQDQDGPYCINWTIKSHHADFSRQVHGTLRQRESGAAHLRVQHRQLIEREYYSDALIPTVEIARTDFDPTVATNLQLLFPGRVSDGSQVAARDLLVMLNEGISVQRPPLETFSAVCHRHGLSVGVCIQLTKQLIWSKHVPVDLYAPVLWDQPLRVATRCVLRERAEWFRRWL